MITYSVRTSDGRACAPAVQTLAAARAARAEAVESGLRSAAIYADLGPPAYHVVLSTPDPSGVSDAEWDGVGFAGVDVVYVADTVPVIGPAGGERLADPAYLAGYLDGLSRDLTGLYSVDEIRACRTGWSEGVAYLVGVHVLAQLCRCGVLRLDEHLWAYDAGCRDGVLAPQEHRTGSPPCP